MTSKTQKTFRLSLSEFMDIEYAIGQIATTGGDEFEFTRFEDGEIAMKVWRDGEASTFCRLGDWAQGVAAMRER